MPLPKANVPLPVPVIVKVTTPTVCAPPASVAADHLTIKDYPGGHMMYLHRPSQEALSNDIVRFIEATK